MSVSIGPQTTSQRPKKRPSNQIESNQIKLTKERPPNFRVHVWVYIRSFLPISDSWKSLEWVRFVTLGELRLWNSQTGSLVTRTNAFPLSSIWRLVWMDYYRRQTTRKFGTIIHTSSCLFLCTLHQQMRANEIWARVELPHVSRYVQFTHLPHTFPLLTSLDPKEACGSWPIPNHHPTFAT